MKTNRFIGPTLKPSDTHARWDCLIYSPNSRCLLASPGDNVVRLWDVDTGKPQTAQFQHPSAVHTAAFSPNGEIIATGCGDGGVRLWEAATGRMIGQPVWHRSAIASMDFSPDGQYLITGSDDFTVRLWLVRPLVRIGPPLLHDSYISAVAFAPDGRTLLTASGDKTACLWKMPARVEGDMHRISPWVQSLTGMYLDQNGLIQYLDEAAWQSCRRELDQRGGPPIP
jgi:WD40 repeat protein